MVKNPIADQNNVDEANKFFKKAEDLFYEIRNSRLTRN